MYPLITDLYGLEKGYGASYMEIDQLMRSTGAKRSLRDSILYIIQFDGTRVFLLVYVDDILIACY